MNKQKSLTHHLVEAFDRYRAEQRATSLEQSVQPSQPNHMRRFLRWLTPNGGTLLLVAALLLTQNIWARQTTGPTAPGPSATTVNYQGRLADSDGTHLDGAYGMSFALYDAASDGSLVWGPEGHTAVPVSDGLFSVGLGSQTGGGIPTTTWNGDRYLEITVGGETLSPRELIRSVPIAGMALSVPDGAITSAKLADAAIPILTASTTEAYWTSPQCDGAYRVIPGLDIDVTIDDQRTLFVNFTGLGHNSGAGDNIYTAVFVDGAVVKTKSGMVLMGGCRNSATDSGWYSWCTLANSTVQVLEPGSHTVEIRVQCDAGEAQVFSGWMNVILFP